MNVNHCDICDFVTKQKNSLLRHIKSRHSGKAMIKLSRLDTAMSKFDQNSPMPYKKLVKSLEVVKWRRNSPLTLSEKVIYSHLDDPANRDIEG